MPDYQQILKILKPVGMTQIECTRRMAIRKSIRNKPKQDIVIETENGITVNEEDSILIVSDWFERAFNADNQQLFPDVIPTEMDIPFSTCEVSRAN